MEIEVLAFGIVKDIFGNSAIKMAVDEGATAGALRTAMQDKYPRLKQLASFMIAVDNEYADNERILKSGEEIAIIPPVSGG